MANSGGPIQSVCVVHSLKSGGGDDADAGDAGVMTITNDAAASAQLAICHHVRCVRPASQPARPGLGKSQCRQCAVPIGPISAGTHCSP